MDESAVATAQQKADWLNAHVRYSAQQMHYAVENFRAAQLMLRSEASGSEPPSIVALASTAIDSFAVNARRLIEFLRPKPAKPLKHDDDRRWWHFAPNWTSLDDVFLDGVFDMASKQVMHFTTSCTTDEQAKRWIFDPICAGVFARLSDFLGACCAANIPVEPLRREIAGLASSHEAFAAPLRPMTLAPMTTGATMTALRLDSDAASGGLA